MCKRELKKIKTFIIKKCDLDDDFESCDIDEILCDFLSDEFGWCINSFNYEDKGTFFEVSNVNWDTTE